MRKLLRKGITYKQLIVFLFIAMVLIRVVAGCFALAATITKDPVEDAYRKKVNDLENSGPLGWMRAAGFVMQTTAEGSAPNSIADALLFNRIVGDAAFASFLSSLYGATRTVGLVLVCLYFFIGLADKLMVDEVTSEIFIQRFMLLLVGVFFILNGDRILQICLSLSSSITDGIHRTFSYAASTVDSKGWSDLYDTLYYKTGIALLIEFLGILIESLFTLIITLVQALLAYILSFFRAMEAGVLYIFAPIGLAPVAKDGLTPSGLKYLKKFISCVLKMGLIMAVVLFSSMFSHLMNGFGSFVAKIVVPIVSIAMMLKVSAIADDIVGV